MIIMEDTNKGILTEEELVYIARINPDILDVVIQKKEEKRAFNVAYFAKPDVRERTKKSNKKYRASPGGREKAKASRKRWLENPANKEKFRAYQRVYQRGHEITPERKEKNRARAKVHYWANRERLLVLSREWRRANKDKCNAKDRERYHRKKLEEAQKNE